MERTIDSLQEALTYQLQGSLGAEIRLKEPLSLSSLRIDLMGGCIQNINAYKVATCKKTHLLTVEHELERAIHLLQQILDVQLATSKNYATLLIHEFNKANSSAKTE